DGIDNALRELRRDHHLVRDALAEQIIEQRPAWLTNALGERPNRARDRATWDSAARTLANFRLEHDVADAQAPLGAGPSDPGERRGWDQANAALERAQRQLGLEQQDRAHELGLGLG
ncbi:MAG: hypothetical protein ACRDLR_08485, partial [Gaiellaceae bacterium]